MLREDVYKDIYQIVLTVAADHFICVDDLLGLTRKKHVVTARCDACHRLRKKGLSLPQIGAMLNRDHSSVKHLLKKSPPIDPRTIEENKRALKARLNSRKHKYEHLIFEPINQGKKSYAEYLKEAEKQKPRFRARS